MTVAVVTPWLNHPELWPDYRQALIEGPWPDEAIIVDNGSDDPAEYVLASDVHVIFNTTNRGFCRACNQGLDAATADIVVFLNNDVEAAGRGWLRQLRDAVEPGVLAGAQLRTDPHTIVDDQLLPYLDGWCLAGLRDDLLELGGFDESLEEPAYYSDNLLCLEARAAGVTLREARIPLIHKLNQTSRDNHHDLEAVTQANRARYEHRVRALLDPTPKGA